MCIFVHLKSGYHGSRHHAFLDMVCLGIRSSQASSFWLLYLWVPLGIMLLCTAPLNTVPVGIPLSVTMLLGTVLLGIMLVMVPAGPCLSSAGVFKLRLSFPL